MNRSRLVALVVMAAAAAAMASWLHVWAGASAAQTARTDYTNNYVGAVQWREGNAGLLYNRQAELEAGQRLGISPTQLGDSYLYPPSAVLVAAPFSLLDLATAYRAWSLFQLFLVFAAVVIVARAAQWPRGLPRAVPVAAVVIAIAGAGTAMTVLEGQWDGLSALGLAIAYACWRRNRPATGAMALAALAVVVKPHLAVGLAAWMLGRRDRRMLAGAAAGVGMVALAALVLVGPTACLAFFSGHVLTATLSPVRMMLGFAGLVGSWLGDSAATYALATIAAAAALAGCAVLGLLSRRSQSLLEVSLGGAVVLSLLASPHLLVQDLVLLALPMVWGLARAADLDAVQAWPGRRAVALLLGWLALELAARVDVGNSAPAPPGRLVPWVLLVAAVAACTACVKTAHLRPWRGPDATPLPASGLDAAIA